MGPARAKPLITICYVLPDFCPVLLASPRQLIDLRRNEFMPGIAVVLLDPKRHAPKLLITGERQKSDPIPAMSMRTIGIPSSHASSFNFHSRSLPGEGSSLSGQSRISTMAPCARTRFAQGLLQPVGR